MMRSLWTAATGMIAQQLNIDVISNNLANVNTIGFKKSRAEFEDLIYQNLKIAGTPTEQGNLIPPDVETFQLEPGVRQRFTMVSSVAPSYSYLLAYVELGYGAEEFTSLERVFRLAADG